MGWWILPAAAGIALGLFVLTLVPQQAHRRGLGFGSWFALQIVAVNPVYPLILVALLPNRAKERRRARYAAELDAKLTAAGRPLPGVGADTVPVDRSVGDLRTTDPAASMLGGRTVARPDRSLGDLPTADPEVPPPPPDRSVGDLPTRN